MPLVSLPWVLAIASRDISGSFLFQPSDNGKKKKKSTVMIAQRLPALQWHCAGACVKISTTKYFITKRITMRQHTVQHMDSEGKSDEGNPLL